MMLPSPPFFAAPEWNDVGRIVGPVAEHTSSLLAKAPEHAWEPYDLAVLARDVDQAVLDDNVERSGNEPPLSSCQHVLRARFFGLVLGVGSVWVKLTKSKAVLRAERFIAGFC